MSAVASAGITARRLVGDPWRRASLRLVPEPGHRAPRAAFVALVLGLLGVGLIGLLVLTTGMQQRAFTIFDLSNEVSVLREERAMLAAELAGLEAPAALAEAADRLGMVPNDTPAFLDLDRGEIRGSLVPASTVAGVDR